VGRVGVTSFGLSLAIDRVTLEFGEVLSQV
jgi:hypothetical protein